MIKTKLAIKKLSKRHLTESGIDSMKKMKMQVEHMKEQMFPCLDCKHIARKLGFEVSRDSSQK